MRLKQRAFQLAAPRPNKWPRNQRKRTHTRDFTQCSFTTNQPKMSLSTGKCLVQRIRNEQGSISVATLVCKLGHPSLQGGTGKLFLFLRWTNYKINRIHPDPYLNKTLCSRGLYDALESVLYHLGLRVCLYSGTETQSPGQVTWVHRNWTAELKIAGAWTLSLSSSPSGKVYTATFSPAARTLQVQVSWCGLRLSTKQINQSC